MAITFGASMVVWALGPGAWREAKAQGKSWFLGSGSSVTVTVALYEPTLTVTGPATANVGERLEFSGTFGADTVH
ncbi:hypothetical protein AB0L53_52020 [Nonomuraea sp. NPDC052129]|uniref:hypothetical protein n=1 Tax=Nonomuraea sp. NPDC052129 TaxID=3154651 RepID=UPI003429D45F